MKTIRKKTIIAVALIGMILSCAPALLQANNITPTATPKTASTSWFGWKTKTLFAASLCSAANYAWNKYWLTSRNTQPYEEIINKQNYTKNLDILRDSAQGTFSHIQRDNYTQHTNGDLHTLSRNDQIKTLISDTADERTVLQRDIAFAKQWHVRPSALPWYLHYQYYWPNRARAIEQYKESSDRVRKLKTFQEILRHAKKNNRNNNYVSSDSD